MPPWGKPERVLKEIVEELGYRLGGDYERDMEEIQRIAANVRIEDEKLD